MDGWMESEHEEREIVEMERSQLEICGGDFEYFE
jgi:hypothetical protein